ncbi:hypothetical protein Fmac_010767 [Flemingia macrophylla]|uniref:Retrotransposon gag domain-containing protein n=1 Tax=Flemingia macrophylla TaxID=520843 RepID=A0ABD1MKI1_9FABA
MTKNKMGFLNGSISTPASKDPIYSPWERCNTLLMSWLLNSLSPSISQSVIFLEKAVDIWNDIKERFSQSDLLRIAELQEEIYAFKQNNLPVSEYFTCLKSIWEKLDNYCPFPDCTCFTKDYHSQDFIIRFLKGLDERFAIVRSQVLLMDPLPSVNRVFSMVIQHEHQQLHPSPPADEPNLFANATFNKSRSGHPGGPGGSDGPNGTRNSLSTKQCSYCHRRSLTVDVCYSMHGYLVGHPRYPRRPCFNHRTDVGNGIAAAASVTPSENKVLPSSGLHFSKVQIQHLLNLLQSNQTDSDHTSQPNSVNMSLTGPHPASSSGFGSNMGIKFVSSLINSHALSFFTSHTIPWIIDFRGYRSYCV